MAEVRSELEAASKLKTGTASFNLLAGVDETWEGNFNAFARADVEFHPLEHLTAAAFVKADLAGVSAGVGLSGTF